MDPACLRYAASVKCQANTQMYDDPVARPVSIHGPHTLLVRPLVRTGRRACHPEYCLSKSRLWTCKGLQLFP